MAISIGSNRSAPYIPTPEEIAERCAEIRLEWDEDEELRRYRAHRQSADMKVYRIRDDDEEW